MKTLIVIFLFFSLAGFAQPWKDTNRGLRPNAIQATINARNTALGVRYSHLFTKPFLGVPMGVYASFSNTVNPDLRFINYEWERKYSIGVSITLPYNPTMHGIYTMATLGFIYNQHPELYPGRDMYKGTFDGVYYETVPWGIDVGIQIQINRFTSHLTVDAVNFFRYAEVGVGFIL
jgi:hypothetical protein